ncbi:rhodanese-like domain-containing protein [Paenibacillus sp. GCM10012307]|uniref:Rhodanese-like domain-containing protein n=1 Tax=Paenibacillus roseus TaxID=2798579 RepID=A0A934MS27_9BACL|nr:rhodanese-like domain-containing protein [Paenibacillus roseus]MBJ6363488.1 rhodanese-like domain-containing protein [Paenibacillus roseus]
MENWQNIRAENLLEKLDRGEIEARQIVDIRETMEWAYYHLEQTRHMPMSTIPQCLDELMGDEDLYIICAHGVRSVAVCRYLSEQGRGNLHNVAGGMADAASVLGFQYD